MPHNPVEELLSDTADFVEKRLAGDSQLCELVNKLVKGGSRPHVVRVLHDVPDGGLLVAIGNLESIGA